MVWPVMPEENRQCTGRQSGHDFVDGAVPSGAHSASFSAARVRVSLPEAVQVRPGDAARQCRWGQVGGHVADGGLERDLDDAMTP